MFGLLLIIFKSNVSCLESLKAAESHLNVSHVMISGLMAGGGVVGGYSGKSK